MRLVLSGYYGFRNSGDEAVLLSILTALEQAGKERGTRIAPIVLSADPAWTSRRYGVEAVPRMKPAAVWSALRGSDGLISGGGSLLQDATGLGSIPYYLGIMKMAHWCGKPVFVYAQGIGPVNRAMFRVPIARAFRKAAYVSVRDEESAALLARMGVPQAHIDVVPDPVMGLPLPPAAAGGPDRSAAMAGPIGDGSGGQLPGASEGSAPNGLLAAEKPPRNAVAGDWPAGARNAVEGAESKDTVPNDLPLVGVSVRFWRQDRADLDRVAQALDALARLRPVRLRFLPLHAGADEEASRYVMQRLAQADAAAELAPAHDEPQAMLREVAGCRLLLGMRLHSLIYAANREVPLLGLSYDPKIDRFLARIGQTAIGSTEALEPDIFAEQAVSILDDPADWLAAARPGIARMKQEVLRPAQQIMAYPRM